VTPLYNVIGARAPIDPTTASATPQAGLQRSESPDPPPPRAYHLSFHVGGGVVADSEPDAEYHETLDKAQAMLRALEAS